jgi:hypothetical protein
MTTRSQVLTQCKSERGEESGRRRLISPFVTTAWTIPDRANPRISGHKISQPIAKAIQSAETSAWPIVDICSCSSEDYEPNRLSRRFSECGRGAYPRTRPSPSRDGAADASNR